MKRKNTIRNDKEVMNFGNTTINKEIKDYHESLFFGLSVRQFACSLVAVGTAVGIYFGLNKCWTKKQCHGFVLPAQLPLPQQDFSSITA